MRYCIGMDVGGTHARLKLADTDGKELGIFENKGGTITSASYEVVRGRYHDLIMDSLNAHGLAPENCAGLCLGASGIDTEELHEQYVRMLESLGFDRAVIRAYNDCEVLLNLYTDKPCIAIIAGTGSIIMGKGEDGKIIRYGGWSYLLSDEGSASYIIRKAIEAALKYWDGYGDCAILASLMESETEMRNQQEAATYYISHIKEKEMISQYAPLVEKAAALGDPTALRILYTAAERLFTGVDVVARQMNLGDAPYVVLLWGSVLMKNAYVSGHLRELLLERFPNAEIVNLEGTAVDCALDIALNIGKEQAPCKKQS